MKSLRLLLFLTICFFQSKAQIVVKDKKYPSLLWEITGKGMKKPSYLMGTMHVSSKMAFNLPDSFYKAIRTAEVVALENNPETWQAEMDKYETNPIEYGMQGQYGNYGSQGDYLTINTLKYYKYESKIERALYNNPPTINSLLYRSFGEASSDFEEDTYLDMYIFQTGRKLGKKTCGVEEYGESMRLMMEAYKDAAKDKNKKERRYSDYSETYSLEKLQEAYRNGDLDLLDSIHKYNSTSDAFDEKFLYKRNEIQANSMDSIIRSGSTLFVGVGAAHLPGKRGVIELLRKMGYKLRPIKWGQRNSSEKDVVDKIRVPLTFRPAVAEDSMYKVEIPGQFYKTTDYQASESQWHFADMANGSYYMVTRIATHAWLWNHNEEKVLKKVDSLLYENIPGKILLKTAIVRNGYKGFDITNRTRRGDVQRYNIFVTPFEVLVFKMSGNGDYVKGGDEANKFFGSIYLREFGKKKDEMPRTWDTYSPPFGGFKVSFPHNPYINNTGNWTFDALDKSTGTFMRVVRTDIHNYGFAGDDTLDLALLEESFLASEFIDTTLWRQQTKHNGYPVLDTRYRDKDGQIFRVRFLLQGPHYYTIVSHAPKETAQMNSFIQSFSITPFVYGAPARKTDTALYYTVTTPFYPESKKIKFDISMADLNNEEDEDNDYSPYGFYNSNDQKEKIIVNDSTGEKIQINFYKFPRYYYREDSTGMGDNNEHRFGDDTTMIVRMRNKTILPNGMRIREAILSDTASSRSFHYKSFFKDGVGYTLTAQSDTLTTPSSFQKNFFDSFQPADTLKGINPFMKKTKMFFEDLASKDSVTRKKALQYISIIDLDSTDFKALKGALENLSWKQKNYLQIKGALLSRMDDINTNESAKYLEDVYHAVGDTAELQLIILETMLRHKTAYAYSLFKDIVVSEPPVLNFESTRGETLYPPLSAGKTAYSYANDSFFDELYDSLKLTKTILTDLLPLMNLEDYKPDMMQLLRAMADSNLVTAKDYEAYYSKFLMEAKQEMRKQDIAEKTKAIEQAEENKKPKKESPYAPYGKDAGEDEGNDNIILYTALLLPFAEKYPAVNSMVAQIWQSKDKKLRYDAMLQMIDKKMPYPDTLLKYYASMDAYRYNLYTDLKDRKQMQLFPPAYNNHIDMGRSALLKSKAYGKPDTLAYLARMPFEYEKKKGFIYFFKYKDRKEDESWKLAVAGMTPVQSDMYEFEDPDTSPFSLKNPSYSADEDYSTSIYDFTELTGKKIKSDKPLEPQLQRQLKKMRYSRSKSGARFYTADQNEEEMGLMYNIRQ